jgi:hypothetical protein
LIKGKGVVATLYTPGPLCGFLLEYLVRQVCHQSKACGKNHPGLQASSVYGSGCVQSCNAGLRREAARLAPLQLSRALAGQLSRGINKPTGHWSGLVLVSDIQSCQKETFEVRKK